MSHLEPVVIRWAVLRAAANVFLGIDILEIARITAIHFDPEEFYKEYDRASVEWVAKHGG